jgi:MoaA/NifB/PqqE/SkfB family radical SAM enzyme
MFFLRSVRVSLTRPGQAVQFARTLRWQSRAARVRSAWLRRGVTVPPIIIFSITRQCNLNCVGCYAFALPREGESVLSGSTGREELGAGKLESIVAEAVDIGVSFFVIAGGEPLMRSEMLDIAGRFPRVMFLVFTNGLLLDEAMADRLARLRNVVCLLSLEGNAAETDRRRGVGTYERLMDAMSMLKSRHLFFGCSVTLTRDNLSTVLSDDFIRGLTRAGCRLFLLPEYTPVDETTDDWALSQPQRELVASRLPTLRRSHRTAVFVAVPWDEELVGGCLSAGRGFVHINAVGDVEPCPFAPYSDVNLKEATLVDALSSPFLASLRAMPGVSYEAGGGCALWKNRAQVEQALGAILESGGAHSRTE